MSLRARSTFLTGLLLGAGLGLAGTGQAQEAEPTTSRVELMLVQEDSQLKAFSLSTGSGAYVETQSLASDTAIATGVIASTDPVASTQADNEFVFYTSDVGTTLPE